MYFWLKVVHILAMTVWFSGLFFLPRLFVARHRREIDADPTYWNPVTNTLFFRLMTPAALITITAGGLLIAWNPAGAWLVLKLVVVAAAASVGGQSGVAVLRRRVRGVAGLVDEAARRVAFGVFVAPLPPDVATPGAACAAMKSRTCG